MRVEITALRAPLEKATRAPWPCIPGPFREDIFSVSGAGGRGREGGLAPRREGEHNT